MPKNSKCKFLRNLISQIHSSSNSKKISCEPIGPQKSISQIQATQKLEVIDIKVTKIDPRKIEVEDSSDHSDEEPIQEGDHSSKIQKIFKDRLKKYKKQEQKKMPKQDAEQFDDPQCVVEFTQEIYQRMRKEEEENMVPVDYLTRV